MIVLYEKGGAKLHRTLAMFTIRIVIINFFTETDFIMNTIYVGNLSRTTTEATLKALFEAYGPVASVKLVKDRVTGEARGFAFVDMEDEEASKQAIAALNGKEVDGQRLRINEARPREQRPGFNRDYNREPRAPREGGFRSSGGGNRGGGSNDRGGGFRSRF
jgi:cold-inducible RNA-binding protein